MHTHIQYTCIYIHILYIYMHTHVYTHTNLYIITHTHLVHLRTQVGQKHGGFIGIIQHFCSLSQQHIWFERKIASDRRRVTNRYILSYDCILHVISSILCYNTLYYTMTDTEWQYSSVVVM